MARQRTAWAGFFCAAMLAAAGQPAGAQDAPPPPPGLAGPPDAIQACLCDQQRLDALRGASAAAQGRFAAAKGRLDALQRQMGESRATIDVKDSTQVDAYRRLVMTEERASAAFFNTVQPAAQAAARRYNAAATAYNAQCAGHPFDAEAMAQARAALECPPADAPGQPLP